MASAAIGSSESLGSVGRATVSGGSEIVGRRRLVDVIDSTVKIGVASCVIDCARLDTDIAADDVVARATLCTTGCGVGW
jgi:hypothetical protein